MWDASDEDARPADPGAVLYGGGDQLVQVLTDLVLAQRALKQRNGLPAEDGDGERDRLRAERLRDRRIRVNVHPGENDPTVKPVDHVREDVVERLALWGPRRPEMEHHDVAHRGLQDVGLEVLIGDVERPPTASASPSSASRALRSPTRRQPPGRWISSPRSSRTAEMSSRSF